MQYTVAGAVLTPSIANWEPQYLYLQIEQHLQNTTVQ